MSEFVRKAMMGFKEVPGGYEDPECTHVILTKQEYAEQLKEINQARREAQSTKYNATEKFKKCAVSPRRKLLQGRLLRPKQ